MNSFADSHIKHGNISFDNVITSDEVLEDIVDAPVIHLSTPEEARFFLDRLYLYLLQLTVRLEDEDISTADILTVYLSCAFTVRDDSDTLHFVLFDSNHTVIGVVVLSCSIFYPSHHTFYFYGYGEGLSLRLVAYSDSLKAQGDNIVLTAMEFESKDNKTEDYIENQTRYINEFLDDYCNVD